MHSPTKTTNDRRGLRICLGVLCTAVGLLVGLSGSAFAGAPANDDFADAHDLDSGSTASASGTNFDATGEPGEPNHDGIPAMASVWYRWTAPNDGAVKINTCRSNFDTVLAVYTGPAIDALRRIKSNNDWCGLQARVRFNATEGTTYLIAVDGHFGAEGSIMLDLQPAAPPPNDDFANAHHLGDGLTGSASGTNVDATFEPTERNHHGVPATASVWYRWTAPAAGAFEIDTCGSRFDTVLAAYTGSTLGTLRRVASNDDSCGRRSRVVLDATAGTSYAIVVDGYYGEQGSIALRLAPSSAFRFGSLKRDETLGTAKLAVQVPWAGDLRLAGTKRLKGSAASAAARGRARLDVRPTRRLMSVLNERGSAWVVAKVTYTAAGGESNTQRRRLKLIKR